MREGEELDLREALSDLLLDLREEFQREVTDLRGVIGPRLLLWGQARWREFRRRPLRRSASAFSVLLPRNSAQWAVILGNWALLLLVGLLWLSHGLGESGPPLMVGTGATLLVLYAYLYDVAWRRPVLLERPPRPPFMPVHKRSWLGRGVRLRNRLDVMWMVIRNEFTGEMLVIGPYCPHCRPRQKLVPQEKAGLLGLTWFGRTVSYQWSCPTCGKSYPRPAHNEERIAESIRQEFEGEEW